MEIYCPACGAKIEPLKGQTDEHDYLDLSGDSDYELIANIRCKSKEKLFTIIQEEY